MAEAGHQVVFAGGSVRDELLGREPGDIDIASSATPEQVMALFPQTVAVGRAFGVVKVIQQGREYDVATFRRDVGGDDGRHPASVEPASLELDVQRRDFTINGLVQDPFSGEVQDMVGGRADLEAGLVRAIGEPGQRFLEDGLRLLRGVRFAALFGFELEPRTAAAMREHAQRLQRVSGERVRQELERMLVPPTRRRALELLDELGLLAVILPELSAMHGVEQPPQFHPEGDVWVHTCLVLESLPDEVSFELALGTLLHDVGKPPTFRRAPDRIRFDGHVERGAEMAQEICARLRLSRDTTRRVVALVADHLIFMNVPSMRPARLRRLMAEAHFDELLTLYKADCAGCHGDTHALPVIEAMLAQLAEEALVPPPLLTGADVLALGVPPGPRVGALLNEAVDLQLEGQLPDRGRGLAWLARRVAAQEGG
ncbi:MAG: CCA tRNA nucleotidyltransferase [Planctomycetota bacterium]|nr:MAG: CCA tRNA nucleotidyltransferase [Planctomycetota bacterium]